MIRGLIIFSLLLSATLAVDAEDLEINGVYQGKNLYVQNPFTANMRDYCTREVYINNKKLSTSINASAFEIDLSFLSVNDPVSIRIIHCSDCIPKILNPQVIKVKSTFSFSSVNLSESFISWSAKHESSKGRYFVERYEHNNWKIVGEVYCDGLAKYQSRILHISGMNKYRLKYMEDNGNIIYSDVVEYLYESDPVTFYPKRVTDNLYLSREADYEVLDSYGNVISKGVKKEVSLSNLPTAVYYLNVDNRTYKFFKK
jgi:hypothetical protein